MRPARPLHMVLRVDHGVLGAGMDVAERALLEERVEALRDFEPGRLGHLARSWP